MELRASLLVKGSETGNGVPQSFLKVPTKKPEIKLFLGQERVSLCKLTDRPRFGKLNKE